MIIKQILIIKIYYFFFSSTKKEFLIRHKTTKRAVKIYNLHVHSKLFKKLSNENFFMSILKKINMNQSTLMSLNLKNILIGKLRGLKLKFLKLLSQKIF